MEMEEDSSEIQTPEQRATMWKQRATIWENRARKLYKHLLNNNHILSSLQADMGVLPLTALTSLAASLAAPESETSHHAVRAWQSFLTELVMRLHIIIRRDDGVTTLPTYGTPKLATITPFVESMMRFIAVEFERLHAGGGVVHAGHAYVNEAPVPNVILFRRPPPPLPPGQPQPDTSPFPYTKYAKPNATPDAVLLVVEVKKANVVPLADHPTLLRRVPADVYDRYENIIGEFRTMIRSLRAKEPTKELEQAQTAAPAARPASTTRRHKSTPSRPPSKLDHFAQLYKHALFHNASYNPSSISNDIPIDPLGHPRPFLGMLTTLEHFWFMCSDSRFAERGLCAEAVPFPFFNLVHHILNCILQPPANLAVNLDATNPLDTRLSNFEEKVDGPIPFNKLALGETDADNFPIAPILCEALYHAARTDDQIRGVAKSFIETNGAQLELGLSWDEAPLIFQLLLILPVYNISRLIDDHSSPNTKKRRREASAGEEERGLGGAEPASKRIAPHQPKGHGPVPFHREPYDEEKHNTRGRLGDPLPIRQMANGKGLASPSQHTCPSLPTTSLVTTIDDGRKQYRSVSVVCDRGLPGGTTVPRGVYANFLLRPFPYDTSISEPSAGSDYPRLVAMGELIPTVGVEELAPKLKSGVCVKVLFDAEDYETELTTLIHAAKKNCTVTPRVVCCGQLDEVQKLGKQSGRLYVLVTDLVGYPLFGESDIFAKMNTPEWDKMKEEEAYKCRLKWFDLQLRPEGIPKLWNALKEALAELRRCGIVHGDLKPDHFMVDPRDGKIKIIDFGSSEVIESYYLEMLPPKTVRVRFNYRGGREAHRVKAVTPFYASRRLNFGSSRAIPSDDVVSAFYSLMSWLIYDAPLEAPEVDAPKDCPLGSWLPNLCLIHPEYPSVSTAARQYLDPIAESMWSELHANGRPELGLPVPNNTQDDISSLQIPRVDVDATR